MDVSGAAGSPPSDEESVPARPAPAADDLRAQAVEVLRAELAELRGSRRGGLSKLLLMLATLAAFVVAARALNWGPRALVLVLGAVGLHEAGHFTGMKLFGYRDVSIFFVPLLGGAVTGRAGGVAAWKRASIALMGPLPGLAAAMACLLLYGGRAMDGGGGLWLHAAWVLVLVNGFNLLPFFPLDGGHFLNDILFCRSRHAELLLRAAGALALILTGLVLVGTGAGGRSSWVVSAVGVIAAFGAMEAYRLAGAAARLRELLPEDLRTGSDEVPAEVVEPLAVEVMRAFPGGTERKLMVIRMDSVWSRVRSVPPGPAASALLLLVYASAVLLALVLAGALILAGGGR